MFHATMMAAALLGFCALAMAEIKVEPVTCRNSEIRNQNDE